MGASLTYQSTKSSQDHFAILLSNPTSTHVNTLKRKIGEQPNLLAECRLLVAKESGVYSFHPLEAYLLGGSYRAIPNDDLNRIAGYARLTNTRWLLFRDSSATAAEARVYDNAPWLKDPTELFSNANYIPRCTSPAMSAVLFEISSTPSP